MQMKIKGLAIIGVLALTLHIAACGSTAGKGTPAGTDQKEEELVVTDTHSDDGRMIVGIAMPSVTLERWNRDGNFLQKNFEEAGYEVIREHADDLIDDQIADIRMMIEANVDLLIITPVDGSSLTKVLQEAEEAAIPIISYDRLLRDSPYIDYYVSFDNYKVGTLQGQFVKEALDLDHAGNNKYNIEITAGDPVDNNARYFYGGMYDVIRPYIESGVLSIPSGQEDFLTVATSSWSTELAEERFSSILNSYYADGKTLSAAICSNDSTAFGVTQAITDNYHGSNQVIVTGQDADEANLVNLLNGKQSMTVYKALPNETIVTLALGKAIMEGKKPGTELIAESSFGFPCVYDTTSYDNGEIVVPSYLLEPVAITKDNVDEELVAPGYYSYDAQGNLKAN